MKSKDAKNRKIIWSLKEKIRDTSFFRSFRNMGWKALLIPPIEAVKLLFVFLLASALSHSLDDELKKIGISGNIAEEIREHINDEGYAQSFFSRIENKQAFFMELSGIMSRLIAKLSWAIAVAIAAISCLNSLTWSFVTKKRISLIFIVKYAGFFSLWNIAWIALMLFTVTTFNQAAINVAMPGLILLFMYFSFIAYPMFAIREKVLDAIKESLRIGVLKAFGILLNFIIAIAVFFIILTVYLNALLLMPSAAYIFMALTLMAVSWLKYFSFEVARNAAE